MVVTVFTGKTGKTGLVGFGCAMHRGRCNAHGFDYVLGDLEGDGGGDGVAGLFVALGV